MRTVRDKITNAFRLLLTHINIIDRLVDEESIILGKWEEANDVKNLSDDLFNYL